MIRGEVKRSDAFRNAVKVISENTVHTRKYADPDVFEFMQDKEGFINYLKREAASNLATFLIDEERFPFERNTFLEEEEKKLGMPPRHIYETSLVVMTPENLKKLLVDFGEELLAEVFKGVLQHEKGRA